MYLYKAAKENFPLNILIALVLGIVIGYFAATYVTGGAAGQATASDDSSVGTVPVFRMWNLAIGDHLYTTSETERDLMLNSGYKSEGLLGYLYPVEVINSSAVFSFYNSQISDHFYTLDLNAEGLSGYAAKGVLGYLYAAKQPASVPVFKLFNPVNGDHFYTTSAAEVKNIAKPGLWVEKGILGYLYANHGTRARRVLP